MIKEIEGVRRCLDVCTQATDEAEKARTNIMEDIATAEDSRQVLVSTIRDLIAAHRVTAGARSLQARRGSPPRSIFRSRSTSIMLWRRRLSRRRSWGIWARRRRHWSGSV